MNPRACIVPDCEEQSFITNPIPLCSEHALTISLNVTDLLHANARTALATDRADVERTRVAPNSVWQQASHPSVVYFLTNGDRVKIGTSTNITARVGALALRKANAALLLQGGSNLENALHDHFADDRIGNTEWFILSPRVQEYIARRKEADSALRQPLLPPDEAEPVTIPAPRMHVERPPIAVEKILEILKAFQDSEQPVYLHKDDICRLADLKETTLNGALTRLKKTGQIHSGPDRGTYGLGPGTEPGE
ncbi:GIY-YIG nuclease family protein [Streptomyces sp. NPDC055966]|uniref:GIY-YIG nuclease family protein n=1 Tax=Streptomyces sp. NPDC055966 TaxID=3345669 RepID=UPI0035DD4614